MDYILFNTTQDIVLKLIVSMFLPLSKMFSLSVERDMYAITFSNDVWVTWRCKCCLLRMICISSFFYKNDTIIDTILSSFMVCCNLRLMLCCSMIEHHEPINFSNCESYAINIDQPSPRMVQKNIKPWKASRSLHVI